MVDVTSRTNPPDFCIGYWRYREGHFYPSDASPDFMAGWCYGLTEKIEQPKPLWESRSFYNGLAALILAIIAAFNPTVIADNPEITAAIGAVFAATSIFLRKLTTRSVR